MLFCLSSPGVVETVGSCIGIESGDLVWIPNEALHAHNVDLPAPCTLLWFRFNGPTPAALCQRLLGEGPPRVATTDRGGPVAWFERLFDVLRRRERNLDFRLNQLVGESLLAVDAGAKETARSSSDCSI